MSTDTHRTFSESKPQMATPNVPPGPKGSQPSKNQVEKINPNQPSGAKGDDDYMDYIKHLSKVRDENVVQREEVQDEDVNLEDHDANAPAAEDRTMRSHGPRYRTAMCSRPTKAATPHIGASAGSPQCTAGGRL